MKLDYYTPRYIAYNDIGTTIPGDTIEELDKKIAEYCSEVPGESPEKWSIRRNGKSRELTIQTQQGGNEKC